MHAKPLVINLVNAGCRRGRAKDTVRSEREGEQVLKNLRNGREPKVGNGIHLLIPEVPLRKN